MKGENGKMKSDLAQTEIEAPYELPEDWKWCRLGEVCKFENGYAFKSDKFAKQGIPVVRITNLKDNEVSLEDCVYTTEDNIEERFIVKKGDLLIAMSGATTGKNGVYLFDKIVYLNQRVGNIKVIDSTILNDKYRNFYIQAKEQDILKNAYGGAQPNISSTKICAMPFPLPPTLAEQQRIVNRIESMFAKLDEAKEKAQNVVDGFETRKAAILHKAFTGELTAKWRKENGVSDDSWVEKKLQEVCIKEITDGTHKTPTYVDEKTGIPFISGKDVSNEIIDWSDLRYIPKALHEELYARLAPQIDDILLSKNGARLGKAAIVETNMIFDIYVTLALLRPNKKIIFPKYLWRVINSPSIQLQIQNHLTGIGMPNLHLRDIKALSMFVPTLPEQVEIVRILDIIIEKENKAKQAAEAVLEQIDLLKKSILARAFRGEL